jgi:hypothetical protein
VATSTRSGLGLMSEIGLLTLSGRPLDGVLPLVLVALGTLELILVALPAITIDSCEFIRPDAVVGRRWRGSRAVSENVADVADVGSGSHESCHQSSRLDFPSAKEPKLRTMIPPLL